MNELETNLAALLKLFQTTKGPLTAQRIAVKLKTYPATAKRRVGLLRKAGISLKEVELREGRRGFPSTAWILQ